MPIFPFWETAAEGSGSCCRSDESTCSLALKTHHLMEKVDNSCSCIAANDKDTHHVVFYVLYTEYVSVEATNQISVSDFSLMNVRLSKITNHSFPASHFSQNAIHILLVELQISVWHVWCLCKLSEFTMIFLASVCNCGFESL